MENRTAQTRKHTSRKEKWPQMRRGKLTRSYSSNWLWRVCVVDGWFTASPGLSQTDWTLAGWGCTPGVHEQSWHPRINQPSTHTLEEEPQPWQYTTSSANTTCLSNSNKHLLYYIYPCPVSEEPKESHFGGVWRRNPATLAPNVGLLRPGRDTEGLSKAKLEPPAAAEDSHPSTSFP